jgi:hypothetical protein
MITTIVGERERERERERENEAPTSSEVVNLTGLL